jgi:hypothetical protein
MAYEESNYRIPEEKRASDNTAWVYRHVDHDVPRNEIDGLHSQYYWIYVIRKVVAPQTGIHCTIYGNLIMKFPMQLIYTNKKLINK